MSPTEGSHVTLIDLDAISVTCRLEAGSTTARKVQEKCYSVDFEVNLKQQHLITGIKLLLVMSTLVIVHLLLVQLVQLVEDLMTYFLLR